MGTFVRDGGLSVHPTVGSNKDVQGRHRYSSVKKEMTPGQEETRKDREDK